MVATVRQTNRLNSHCRRVTDLIARVWPTSGIEKQGTHRTLVLVLCRVGCTRGATTVLLALIKGESVKPDEQPRAYRIIENVTKPILSHKPFFNNAVFTGYCMSVSLVYEGG